MNELEQLCLLVGSIFVILGLAILMSKDFLWKWELSSRRIRNIPSEESERTEEFDKLMGLYGGIAIFIGAVIVLVGFAV